MRSITQSALRAGIGTLALSLLAGRAAADMLPADKLPEAAVAENARASEVEYLRRIHAQIHRRWADNFLRLVGEKLPLANPLNETGRTASVDLTIARDGQLIASQVTAASGFPGFDDAIMEVLRDSVPFPLPPEAVRSDDDKLHLRWVFARDQRRCAGVTIVRVNDPPDISLPKLLHMSRYDESLSRVALARAAGAAVEPMMTTLASEWTKSAIHEPWATTRMARMLAEHGDNAAVSWLKQAVKRPELARAAGEALAANKVAICPLVKASFDSESLADHQVAAEALTTAGEGACAPPLVALLQNPKARPEARVAAAVALGPIDDEGTRKALAAAAKEDKSDVVRAAALLAGVRPGAGRGKVLAMVQVIRDPSAEIRAAACAGVVRAGGNSNLEDLYVLFKDSDPRPSEATLRELDRLGTEEAIVLVSRLARRPQPSVQKLAAQILVRRRARAAFSALKGYLDPATDPQLRGMALVAADDALLASLGADPKMGPWVYRAYLARGDRDRAGDWFIAHAPELAAAQQADALVDWLETKDAPSTVASDARKARR
jgi:TonB family protein